jgi:LmbE family N-acetylglucosaminyl deacetylase
MTHVFVSPHPDDAAFSCGGLIADLCARGEAVTIVTVFCGPGSLDYLTPFQRLALGFGAAAPVSGANIADAEAPGAAPTPERVMAVRRAEDAAYASLVGATVVFVKRPDAVFRGYEGDAQLMGPPRDDDPAPVEELRAALSRLQVERLYLPLSVGGHVDHRQARRAAIALLAEPDSPYRDRAWFYEDFPYSLKFGFERLDQLDPEILPSLPAGVTLVPEYFELGGTLIDRKLAGLRAYASQLDRTFGGDDRVPGQVRERAARVGELGRVGPAERYWRVIKG